MRFDGCGRGSDGTVRSSIASGINEFRSASASFKGGFVFLFHSEDCWVKEVVVIVVVMIVVKLRPIRVSDVFCCP